MATGWIEGAGLNRAPSRTRGVAQPPSQMPSGSRSMHRQVSCGGELAPERSVARVASTVAALIDN